MSTLFICAFSPSKKALQAGHRLAFDFLREIALTSNTDVALLLRKGEVVSPDLYLVPNVNIVYVKYFTNLNILKTLVSKASISSFFTRYDRKIEDDLLQLVENNKYDIVRLEFSQVFYYGLRLREKFKDSIKIYISSHDIQVQLALRKSFGLRSIFIKSIYDIEEKTLKIADKVYAISKKDANFINTVYGNNIPTQVLDLILPDFIKEVRRDSNLMEKGSLLFWGAMNRPENEDSIIYFIEKVFNEVSENLNLKLYIVGAHPGKKLLGYASSRIVITGFLDNPTAYFEKAQLGIVPLLFGAGLKLKTLEMLTAGLPVLSTYIGAEGIEPTEKDKLMVTEIANFSNTLALFFKQYIKTND